MYRDPILLPIQQGKRKMKKGNCKNLEREWVIVSLSCWDLYTDVGGGHLFWIGFDLLGGAFLRLVSTDLWAPSKVLLNSFTFEANEATETSNLLGWFLSLLWTLLSSGSNNEEDPTRVCMRIKAKKTSKALWLVFIVVVVGQKESEKSRMWEGSLES